MVQLSDGETVYDIERVIAGIDGTGTADTNVQTATGLCAVLADIESCSLTFECMSEMCIRDWSTASLDKAYKLKPMQYRLTIPYRVQPVSYTHLHHCSSPMVLSWPNIG